MAIDYISNIIKAPPIDEYHFHQSIEIKDITKLLTNYMKNVTITEGPISPEKAIDIKNDRLRNLVKELSMMSGWISESEVKNIIIKLEEIISE